MEDSETGGEDEGRPDPRKEMRDAGVVRKKGLLKIFYSGRVTLRVLVCVDESLSSLLFSYIIH